MASLPRASVATQAGRTARRALLPGALAGFVSQAAAAALSRLAGNTIAHALNAPSHWFFGRRAQKAAHPSRRYTPLGIFVHQTSAFSWAMLYDRWQQLRPGHPWRKAAAVAALAYVTDYHVVPRRLTPGFEALMPRKRLPLVYGAFAIGLALSVALRKKR